MAEFSFNIQYAFRNNHSGPYNNGNGNNRGNERIDFFKSDRLSHEYYSMEHLLQHFQQLQHISSDTNRFNCSHHAHRIHPSWNFKSIQGGRIKNEFVCSDKGCRTA